MTEQGKSSVTRSEFEGKVEEALDWLVRLHAGSGSAQLRQDFDRWLTQDPVHAQAFGEAQSLWEDLARVTHTRPVVSSMLAPVRRWVPRVPTAMQAVAAVSIVVLSWIFLPVLLKSVQVAGADYRTGLGEQAVVSLADGTSVHLNTRTALNVTMSKTERRITLLEGEANFVVAPDGDRPFIVVTASATAMALGTEFTVRAWDEETIVSVLEHSVLVAATGEVPKGLASSTLQAGEQVRVNPGRAGMGEVKSVNPMMVKAWQHGKLLFDGEPLGRVVAELNRYRPGVILMMNPELESMRVTGVFDLTDPGAGLQAMQETLPISSLTLTPYLTVIF